MRMLIAVLMLLSAGVLVACGSSSSKAETLGSTTYNDHGTKSAQGKSSIELEADNYYFEPTFVRGDPGKTVQLELKNDAGTQHNFSVTSQHIDQDIPAKGSVTISVTIPPSGVMPFFCKFHTGQGMNGELLSGDAKPQAPGGAAAPVASPKSQAPGYRGY